MHVVETKHVREVLLFRIKSLNAVNMPEISSIVERDLAEIMQHEKTIVMGEDKNVQVDRMWRVRNGN
jgi:hypothetical protein